MGKGPTSALFAGLLLIALAAPRASEIHTAAEQGDSVRVAALLQADPALLEAPDESGYRPLHEAAYNNQQEVVRFLLSQGAEVNATSTSGSTPLHGAAYGGFVEVTQLLLDAGADVNPVNGSGYTPLLSACAGRKSEAAKLLISAGADLSARTGQGWTPLLYAARSGDSALVRSLLDKGADVNAAADNGVAPLYQALWANSLPCVRMLVEAGGDANAKSENGTTLPFYAIAFRDSTMSNLVPGGAANALERDSHQFTMLHYAAARGLADRVRALLAEGAEINARGASGRTPLDYALMWGQDEVAKILKDAGGLAVDHDTPWLSGEYLGEKDPGRNPVVFAKNALLSPYSPHGSLVYSPDGTEMLWCYRALPRQVMWYMRQEGGKWKRPMIAPFTDGQHDYNEAHPSFTADGNRIFFHSKRPLTPGGEPKDEDIWYVDRVGDSWGTPVNLGSPVNTDKDEFDPTVGPNGDLYFTANQYENTLGAGDIYVSRLVNGVYTEPVNLGEAFNSDTHDMTPTFAPDGSCMVFPSARVSLGNRDVKLLACFREPDGDWSDVLDLGRGINQGGFSWHPTITPDGKYLIYLHGNDYYWISAEVLDDMKAATIGFDTPTSRNVVRPTFRKSDQYFEHAATNKIALADFDGDGDLDAVFSNMRLNDSRIYLNDGHGGFTVTDQLLTQQGHGVGTGDLDGDGDIDIFMTCAGYGQGGVEYSKNSKVYLNDGHAQFTDTQQDLQDSLLSGNALSLHDIDNDGDLDAMIKYYQEPNRIYLNDGQANFSWTGLTYPDNAVWGDVDGDGDPDIFTVDIGQGLRCLLNDGAGQFSEVWRHDDSTTLRGRGILLDLDDDGLLDVVLTLGEGLGASSTTVWRGDGAGHFTLTETELPATRWGRFQTGDFNRDGRPDLTVVNFGLPTAVWLTDAQGKLFDSGLRFRTESINSDCALGDVDGDGDLDVFVSAFGGGPNELWLNTSGE